MRGVVDCEDGEEGTVDKGIPITHNLSWLNGVNLPTHRIWSTHSRKLYPLNQLSDVWSLKDNSDLGIHSLMMECYSNNIS